MMRVSASNENEREEYKGVSATNTDRGKQENKTTERAILGKGGWRGR